LPSAFYEVMRCAPSTRYFTDEPVPRELLHRVLDNASYAPSGGNRQGWRVIVVTDPAVTDSPGSGLPERSALFDR
jgi:nitroreductase